MHGLRTCTRSRAVKLLRTVLSIRGDRELKKFLLGLSPDELLGLLIVDLEEIDGPRYIKIGALVRYRPEDIERFINTRPSGGGAGTARPG